ncbi:MAG: type II secretion system protein [Ghiorsea sp.]
MVRKTNNNQGFSLIELIGVLAIISILASVLVPNMIKRIDLATGDAEIKNLTLIAQELEQYMTTKFIIPSPLNWSSSLASVSSLPASKIAQNDRGFQRGFYVDPRFFSAIDTPFAGYTQGTGLLSAPVSPRVMMVSNLKADAPLAPNTSSAFDAIWNQTVSSPIIENDDIKIHRIYLGHLFHHLLLLNGNTLTPFYTLGAGAPSPIPASVASVNGQTSIFVLHGTQLNLHQTPFPTGPLQYTLFIHERDSFLYGTNGLIWFWGRP